MYCVGVKTSPADIKKGFKKAFAEPWPERLRYEVCSSVFLPLLLVVHSNSVMSRVTRRDLILGLTCIDTACIWLPLSHHHKSYCITTLSPAPAGLVLKMSSVLVIIKVNVKKVEGLLGREMAGPFGDTQWQLLLAVLMTLTLRSCTK